MKELVRAEKLIPESRTEPVFNKDWFEMRMLMNARWMAIALSVGLGACTDDTASEPDENTVQELKIGSVELQLTGADSSGRAYRLRNAEFLIYGYSYGYDDYPGGVIWSSDVAGDGDGVGGGGPVGNGDGDWASGDGDASSGDGDGDYPGHYHKVVSSETDLDASTIVERVVPGEYYIQLNNGWYLERFENGDWNPVEKSVLLSSRSQYVYVYHGYTSRVAFRFGVDGDLIDFRAGYLEIGIEIEQPGEGPANPPCPGFPFPLPFPPGWCFPTEGDAGIPSDGGVIEPWPSEDAGVSIPGDGDSDAGVDDSEGDIDPSGSNGGN